ncbi:four-carbon acid sugar kinase family protein [Raineyella fluvialis]|uniref:Four-carbon acid sugar kinase family protein n=1 Tax=Raineyella fluvialis TaxID=2662261 RepID=A0A5Q2FEW6_9ACTN|nr:four-carbon acid sugar kinase family protein [Raineyella fluvialis]QGF23265.1 four-carbon acid sugar kinase family protein [Raineyella fluvialis]
MPSLGIIADDLTGATTVGALLARVGVDTVVLFDAGGVGELDGDHEAVIINSDSRALPGPEAYARVHHATQDLVDAGARLFSKRIDTTCRGGIGPEVEGMLSVLGDDYVAVVVPAMPQSRRIVVGGYSLIDSVLLARTPVAVDVRTPVTESNLRRLLAGQCSVAVGQVGIDAVLAGTDCLKAALVEERAAGARAILVDATSLEDVDTIALALVELGWKTVCVDPGPFTERMAIRSGVVPTRVPQERTTRLHCAESDRGTVLVVAGSATGTTNGQMNELRQVPGTEVVEIAIGPLIGEEAAFTAEAERAFDEVTRLMNLPTPPRVVMLGLESTLSGRVVDLAALERGAGLEPGTGPSRIPLRLGEIGRRAAVAIGCSLAGLYLTGGDVMVNTCKALGTRGLGLVDYVIPQADQGVVVGGPWDGIPVVCKGGLTGTPQTAVQCVNRIFDENNRSSCQEEVKENAAVSA